MVRPHRAGRRAALGLAAGLGAVLVLAMPAQAEPVGRISDIQPSDDGLTLVFSASDLPAGASLDPASVEGSINGTSVPATAELIGGQTAVKRSAVLVIDTSGSMQGDKLEAAKNAANAYLQAAPSDLPVGLVSFNDRVTVEVTPTSDHAAVAAAVQKLEAGDGTALYDATIKAVEVVGEEGSRTILLLSDGRDFSSRQGLDSAVATLDRSGATLDAVALGSAGGENASLQTLTSATGGKVVVAGTDDLTAMFAASARALDNQLKVSLTIPPDLAGSGSSVTVSTLAAGQTITDTAFVPIPGAPQGSGAASPVAAGPIPVTTPAWVDRVDETWLWVGLAALFGGLAVLLAIGIIRASRRDPTSVRGRMSIYTLGGKGMRKESETTSTALGDTQVARSVVDFAGRAVRDRNLEELLERKLDAAGLPFKPGEWALIHVGIAIGGGLLLLLLTGGRIAASLLGLALGVVLPWLWLGMKETRRQSAFYTQLPDTLQLLAGSLSAGYSLPQAVDTVVREGNNPIASEFNRALVEARLGVPIEDALDSVADRMNSKDFHWVVLAIRVQREVGGNLAELLNTVAATLRERERLRRQVQVLSAEGRLSAVIIAMIPVLFAVFLIIVRPTYLEPLYSTALGLLLLGFGVLMLIVGAIWLRRVVRVEV
jgi:tight adherence protein B